MKLSTRLALVVSAILVVTTVATSTQAFISMRHEKLATMNSVLNNIVKQLNLSKEDDLSLGLYLAEHSPIPMSLAYVTDSKEVTYLLENANLDFEIPQSDFDILNTFNEDYTRYKRFL